MNDDYIKKLEQENQLLHMQNDELLEENKKIPELLGVIIDKKRKANYILDTAKENSKGLNTLLQYLADKKEYTIKQAGVNPFIIFKINDNYEDNFSLQHPMFGDDDIEKITEKECLDAGYKIDPEKKVYYKGGLEDLYSASSAPGNVDVIYPNELIDTSIKNEVAVDTAGYEIPESAEAYYADEKGNPIDLGEIGPEAPKGFNVWPIITDDNNTEPYLLYGGTPCPTHSPT